MRISVFRSVQCSKYQQINHQKVVSLYEETNWHVESWINGMLRNSYLQPVEKKQNILVTGATGLLGTHLLVRLAKQRKEMRRIIALRRGGSDMEEVKRVFSFYGDGWEDLYDAIEWRYGDMLDPESLRPVLKGVDLVYHCAAIVSFDPAERENLIQANVQGTKNLLNAIPPPVTLIHISSTSALGDSPGNDPAFLVDEKTPRDPTRRHSGYSISKYESEKIVWEAIDQGLNAMIVNPGIILGPGFWDKGSSKLFSAIRNGLKFYTDGGTGYVDVRDVVEALVEGQKTKSQNGFGERFCLVGTNISFRDFFNLVADELRIKRPSIRAGKFLSGLAWRIETIKARLTGTFPLITRETAESANRFSFYSSEKIKQTLNFKFTPINETIKWVCSNMNHNKK